MALRLRRENIMTLKWMAQRLHMGSWTQVSNCLATTTNEGRSVNSEDPFTAGRA